MKSNAGTTRRFFILFAIMGILMTASLENALAAGNPTLGRVLAVKWCSACHIVTPDQTTGNPDVPPFKSIARKPGFSADFVAAFLVNPHPKMPDMHLSRDEIDDLAAYIASLK